MRRGSCGEVIVGCGTLVDELDTPSQSASHIRGAVESLTNPCDIRRNSVCKGQIIMGYAICDPIIARGIMNQACYDEELRVPGRDVELTAQSEWSEDFSRLLPFTGSENTRHTLLSH